MRQSASSRVLRVPACLVLAAWLGHAPAIAQNRGVSAQAATDAAAQVPASARDGCRAYGTMWCRRSRNPRPWLHSLHAPLFARRVVQVVPPVPASRCRRKASLATSRLRRCRHRPPATCSRRHPLRHAGRAGHRLRRARAALLGKPDLRQRGRPRRAMAVGLRRLSLVAGRATAVGDGRHGGIRAGAGAAPDGARAGPRAHEAVGGPSPCSRRGEIRRRRDDGCAAAADGRGRRQTADAPGDAGQQPGARCVPAGACTGPRRPAACVVGAAGGVCAGDGLLPRAHARALAGRHRPHGRLGRAGAQCRATCAALPARRPQCALAGPVAEPVPDGPSFVAVGAVHLVGPTGCSRHSGENGYQVEAMPL